MLRKMILAAVVAACCATSRSEVRYTVTDLGSLDSSPSSASSINNSNQIVGVSGTQGFFYSGNGPMIPFPAYPDGINDVGQIVNDDVFYPSVNSPGQPMFVANGVDVASTALNNLGHATGFDFFQNGSTPFNHAFLFRDGIVQDLGALDPSANSVAFGINDFDQIVGRSAIHVGTAFEARAILWTPALGMQDIGTLGGNTAVARSINNGGMIVGVSNLVANGPGHVFITSVGSHAPLSDLGTIGDTNTIPSDINNEDVFVGMSDVGAFTGTPTGPLQNLNDLIDPTSGWSLLTATSVNDAGYVVGQGINPTGQYHAFLLTPLPDPAALPVLLLPAILLLRRPRLPQF